MAQYDESVAERLDIGGDWQRVSPRYVWIVLIGSLIAGLVSAAIAVVIWLAADWAWWGWLLIAAVVVGYGIQLI